jgi:hypothetical protein
MAFVSPESTCEEDLPELFLAECLGFDDTDTGSDLSAGAIRGKFRLVYPDFPTPDQLTIPKRKRNWSEDPEYFLR